MERGGRGRAREVTVEEAGAALVGSILRTVRSEIRQTVRAEMEVYRLRIPTGNESSTAISPYHQVTTEDEEEGGEGEEGSGDDYEP